MRHIPQLLHAGGLTLAVLIATACLYLLLFGLH